MNDKTKNETTTAPDPEWAWCPKISARTHDTTKPDPGWGWRLVDEVKDRHQIWTKVLCRADHRLLGENESVPTGVSARAFFADGQWGNMSGPFTVPEARERYPRLRALFVPVEGRTEPASEEPKTPGEAPRRLRGPWEKPPEGRIVLGLSSSSEERYYWALCYFDDQCWRRQSGAQFSLTAWTPLPPPPTEQELADLEKTRPPADPFEAWFAKQGYTDRTRGPLRLGWNAAIRFCQENPDSIKKSS